MMEHDIMHISVVVPFYNSERYIALCIEGLLSQRYPRERYEIIMIDNNSTDRSAKIVKRYPHVKLLSEERQGAYAARNRGIKEAKGEVIAFTDPDCIPLSNWLQEIETAMTRFDVGIVLGSYCSVRDSFILSALELYQNEKRNYIFGSRIKELYYGYANNMAVRKRLLEEVGLFIERDRGSDSIFVQQCVNKYSCEIVRYFPNIQVRHMEIESLGDVCQKYFIYGNSKQQHKHIAYMRGLTNWERLEIFRSAVQKQRYDWIKSTLLVGLLAVPHIYWVLGGIRAAWNLKVKPRLLYFWKD